MTTEWIAQKDGTKFYTKTWKVGLVPFVCISNQKPEGTPVATVVFVHGFIEHIERYNHVFEKFAAKGIEVYGWDQRGFGKTSEASKTNGITQGWTVALNDIEDALVKYRQPGIPQFLMGHSMGGGLVLTYAATKPDAKNLAGLIASAPLIEQDKASKAPAFQVISGTIASKILPSMQIPIALAPEMIARDKEVQDLYANDPLVHGTGSLKGVADMLAGGKALGTKNYKTITLPLLIAHGTEDKLTSYEASKAFFEKVPSTDKTFETYPGAYHELHNEKEEKEQVTQLYIDWILKHVTKA